ncbi:hypothetical protein F383_36963 [Gossypium arboreum]|uniref:Uncharacterized protein n=1 Tax=Gossypium arboreum TaxID=29729 RepID=A0A0B0MC31_GOSAR|nr:hypothetical protein F383_36963 [Gossypium arboreum]
MRASVRPCLGQGIGIETRASVKHVWDMHRPQDDMASTPYPMLEAYVISSSIPDGSTVKVIFLS